MKPATKTAVNLLPRDDLHKKPMAKFLKWFLTYGRIIMIVTEIITIAVFLVGSALNVRNNQLKQQINTNIAYLNEATQLESQIRSMQYRLSSMREIHSSRKKYLYFMEYLGGILPEAITLQDITVTTGSMELTAATTDEAAFATFIHNIKSAPVEKINTLQIASVARGGKNPNEIVFSLSVQLGPKAFEKD